MALDGSGAILVAGRTSATDFLPESLPRGPGFLAVISADGSRFISATRLPAAPEIGAMRLTSTGQLVMGATTQSGELPTTPGVSQSEYRGCLPGQYPTCYQGACSCLLTNGYVFRVMRMAGSCGQLTWAGIQRRSATWPWMPAETYGFRATRPVMISPTHRAAWPAAASC